MTRAVLTTSGAPAARPGLLLPAGLFLLAAMLTGCAGRDGRKILTSANAYVAINQAYEARCVAVAGTACLPCWEALLVWRRALDDASKAYSRGGKFPGQLAHLQGAQKHAEATCSK